MSKFKAVAGNVLIVVKLTKHEFERTGIIVGKGENAG